MSKTNHTPWTIAELPGDARGDCVILDVEAYEVCCFRKYKPALDEANAKLVAAAPDLLAALQEAYYLFAHGVGASSSADPDNATRNVQEARRIMALAKDAISKAGGKLP